MSSEHLFDDLAGAVLDGKAVDWPAAESRANADARAIVRRLRLIATVVDAHRALLPADEAWCAPSPCSTAPPERWGHLRLHERIGRGAFGEVFAPGIHASIAKSR